MVTVEILDDNDLFDPEDWCRPLQLISMNGGHSDFYSFTSQYSGTPENNVQWVKVREVFGGCWYGQKIGKFHQGSHIRYEFLRGNVPADHTMKSDSELKEEQEQRDSQKDNTPMTFGKYIGKTPNEILRIDHMYLDWLSRKTDFRLSKTILSKLAEKY